MRCIEAGEDLRVGGEKLRESAEDLGIMVLGFEALSLIGGRVDDDDVVGSSAHETAPGFEEIVREVACSLANLGGEVEVMVFRPVVSAPLAISRFTTDSAPPAMAATESEQV